VSSAIAQLEEQGTLLFSENEIPLSKKEWQQLEQLVNKVEYEHVIGGDAGEGHSVWVCRFFNDIKKPTALHESSAELSAIVISSIMKAF
jgi:hypothetical protein